MLHGIGDSKSGSAGFAPLLLSGGYSVLAPDSRAHGESGGSLVTYGLLEKYDLLDWATRLREMGCTRLYALGESLGGAVALQASSVQPVFRAIVAECSYSDLRTIARERVEQMFGLPRVIGAPASSALVGSGLIYARLRYGLDLGQVSPESAIARTSTPILLIHGVDDWRTPPSHSEALARANPRAALWLVPRAGHTAAWSADPVQFEQRVLGWFAEH